MPIIYIKLLVQTILLFRSKRLYKNNFENNTVYKNYNNSQISRHKYYMGSKIWDIA